MERSLNSLLIEQLFSPHEISNILTQYNLLKEAEKEGGLWNFVSDFKRVVIQALGSTNQLDPASEILESSLWEIGEYCRRNRSIPPELFERAAKEMFVISLLLPNRNA
jgi:hypothetical protein